MRLLVTLSIAMLLVITLRANNKILKLNSVSNEFNIGPGLRDKVNGFGIKSNLQLSAFNLFNFKIGVGTLSVYDKYDNVYDASIQTFSIVPFLSPINSDRIQLNIGMGYSELRYHLNNADMWGPMNIGDGEFLAQHVVVLNEWVPSLEMDIDLNFRISSNTYIGWQFNYYGINSNKYNSRSFFTTGIKLLFQFNK